MRGVLVLELELGDNGFNEIMRLVGDALKDRKEFVDGHLAINESAGAVLAVFTGHSGDAA